ncbi:hypothetical protein BEWA_018340 [Theileria equi strain WA]|uniref:Uncharacterized protein n=1 Tax=Theileria equi strain WA TaxID=1537102 RepID=L0ATX1_THEEQ|nr:hypothetical protein BEWA_018340 [Theileria equi strain WA]AFZ78990.1 hypothetical protein BEWA_018340 [Theileria equi strain WA]|eukprot:XP_004828656.1 hypothetical protein BEWA_018340 [Theileria equi strain WA]
MFKCRICSGTPFSTLFGFGDSMEHTSPKNVGSDTEDVTSTAQNADELSNIDSEDLNELRSAEEVAFLVKAWDAYVHERAKALWKTPAKRYSILASIAKECDKRDDPVLGNDITCVKWKGKYEDDYPIIYVNKPDENVDSSTYVNRMLVFLFADQESYEKIDKTRYKAFEMVCGNKWCINLTHISLC